MAYTWTDLTFSNTPVALAVTLNAMKQWEGESRHLFKKLGVHSTPFVDPKTGKLSEQAFKKFSDLQQDLNACLRQRKEAFRACLCGKKFTAEPLPYLTKKYGEEMKNAKTLDGQFEILAHKYKRYLSYFTKKDGKLYYNTDTAAGQFYVGVAHYFRPDTVRRYREKMERKRKGLSDLTSNTINRAFQDVWDQSPYATLVHSGNETARALANIGCSISKYQQIGGNITPVERLDACIAHAQNGWGSISGAKGDNALVSTNASTIQNARKMLEMWQSSPTYTVLKDNPFYQHLINWFVFTSVGEVSGDDWYAKKIKKGFKIEKSSPDGQYTPAYFSDIINNLNKTVTNALEEKLGSTQMNNKIFRECQNIGQKIMKDYGTYRHYSSSYLACAMPDLQQQKPISVNNLAGSDASSVISNRTCSSLGSSYSQNLIGDNSSSSPRNSSNSSNLILNSTMCPQP